MVHKLVLYVCVECFQSRYLVSVHLSEVDILRSCEVEALLVALMLQQTLCQPVSHFHITAVVFLCVQGCVGQHGCCLLNMSGVQE